MLTKYIKIRNKNGLYYATSLFNDDVILYNPYNNYISPILTNSQINYIKKELKLAIEYHNYINNKGA